MYALKWGTSLGIGVIALTGCAVIPDSPSVAVMPAPGKPFEVFIADDQFCRSFASQSSGGNTQKAVNTNAVGAAAATTAIGAVAGGLIGNTAASYGVGAGFGLLMGAAIGAGESSHSSYALQRRYDIAYEQCMYAKGNLLPGQSIPNNASLPPPPGAPPPPQ